MDTKKLEALLTAVELGSFTRAAEVLGYTQSGLTHMMNSLENEIGLRLLDRSYSGVRLSETGKTLMPKIHRLLQVYDALNGEINACKCAQQATLRLAALDTVVPLPGGGQIHLCWDERELRVLTDRPGGVLIWQGQCFPLTAGQELRLSR